MIDDVTGSGSDALACLEEFWAEVMVSGSPLVEPVGAEALVTFVWRGKGGERVFVQGNRLFDTSDLGEGRLELLPGTDVWWAGFRLPAEWRGSYRLLQLDADVGPGGKSGLESLDAGRRRTVIREAIGLVDPLNDRPVETGPSAGSELRIAEGPKAPAQPWFTPRPAVPAGTISEHRLPGPSGDGEHRLWRYVPPAPARGLVLLLDGAVWAEQQPIWPTLDNLLADGLTPPLSVLAIDSGVGPARAQDLACSPAFTRWLDEMVLPEFAPDARPETSVVAGQSLGGLAALYLGQVLPQRFGSVLSQSGAFWFKNTAPAGAGAEGAEGDAGDGGADGQHREWLTRALADLPTEVGHPRCELQVGSLEWVTLPLVQRVRDVLRARGAQVEYREFVGGHDSLCWRGGLAEGLLRLTAAFW